MIEANRMRLLWASVLCVWLLAAGMTWSTARYVKEAKGRFARKIGEYGEMKKLAGEIEAYRGARRATERLPTRRPVPLESLLKGLGLDFKLKEVASATTCAPGWVVRQKDVDLGEVEVELGRVAALVKDVEGRERTSPPWRLARLHVRSSNRTAGSGQTVILFEALEQIEGAGKDR